MRRSVRSVRGNQWMFRIGHPADQPLRIRPELLRRSPADGTFPILAEKTPVRMDLTHSTWSDIFFLGMDTYYTELLIDRVRRQFGDDFWGFWMLGGMSGGGMGFIFAPQRKPEAQRFLSELMRETKRGLETALPFAMEPVVYDFAINPRGTNAELLEGERALLPASYYTLMAPQWLRTDPRELTSLRRAELDRFGAACRTRPELAGVVETLFDRLLPRGRGDGAGERSFAELLESTGFDREQHEQIRADLKAGRTGLAQNRLPASSSIGELRLRGRSPRSRAAAQGPGPTRRLAARRFRGARRELVRVGGGIAHLKSQI